MISLSYDNESKMFKQYNTDKVAKYVELNQDLYVSIIETNYQEEEVVIYGKKLERYAEPKYSDAFHATFMSYDATQLVTKFTHGEENNRKLQIKIGKITDNSILTKIKNQNSSGFADLLTFAKSNNAIYDKIVDVDRDNGGYAIEYNSLINLTGLQEDAYYFLYVKTDDENGKYISQEAVTLAQASIPMDNCWYLFFYGSNDFEWADFGTMKEPDDTTAPGIIPNAGLNTIIWMTAGVALAGVFSYKQYRKNNF